MTDAPYVVYIGPAMDLDGKPTWGRDWVQIGDWDTSLDGLTFAEHGKRFVDAELHDALVKAADDLADAADEDLRAWSATLVERSALGIALAAYRKAKEKVG